MTDGAPGDSPFFGLLRRWIAALLAGDRAAARRCLSPTFGRHEGLDAAAYLEHELGEFRRRALGFGLERGFTLRPAPAALPGGVGFFVLNAEGQFAYEDALAAAPDGLLAGTGRPFEAITKLAFERGQPPRRAIALRAHGAPIVAVTPLGAVVEEARLAPGLAWDDDGFLTYAFRLPDDDLATRPLRLRVLTAAGGATMPVLLRGADHPHFVGGLEPVIAGATVHLDPTRGRLWGLSVRLVDGRTRTIDCPDRAAYHFPAPVAVATVTDAVDNDWTARAA